MSIRERMYPEKKELPVLVRHCADARYVWNLGLEQRNLWVPGRVQKITYNSQAHELAELRRETWLGEGSWAIQQQALRDLVSLFRSLRRNNRAQIFLHRGEDFIGALGPDKGPGILIPSLG
ncbi:MAG: hypothetical protein ACYDHP_04225, partial [Ferrimicrobium sp.]